MDTTVKLTLSINAQGQPILKAVTDDIKKLSDGQVKLQESTTATGRALEGMVGSLSGYGSQLGAVGNWLGSLGPAGVAASAALGGIGVVASSSLQTLSTLATQVRDLSYISGASPESISALVDVIEDLGVSSETVQLGIAKMSAAIESGSPTLKRLGISIRDNNGHLKNALALFYESIDALGGMTSSIERNGLARELFGRGWTSMVPVIEQGSASLKAMAAESNKVLSKEDLDRAKDYKLAISNLGDAVDALKLEVGRGVIVPITMLVQWLTPNGKGPGSGAQAVQDVKDWFGPGWAGMGVADVPGMYTTPLIGDYGSYDDPSLRGGIASRKPDPMTEGERKALEEARKAEEAARKARAQQDEYFAKLDEKALEQMQKDRAEFLKWDTDQVAAEVKRYDEANAQEVKGNAEAIAEAKKDEAEYLKWLGDQEADAAKKQAERDAYLFKVEQDFLDRTRTEQIEFSQWKSRKDEEDFEKAQTLLQKQKDEFRYYFSSVTDAVSTSIRGVIQGTQTMEQAVKNAAQNIGLSLVDKIVNKGLDVVADAFESFLFGAKGTTGGGVVGSLLGTTAATVAGGGSSSGGGGGGAGNLLSGIPILGLADKLAGGAISGAITSAFTPSMYSGMSAATLEELSGAATLGGAGSDSLALAESAYAGMAGVEGAAAGSMYSGMTASTLAEISGAAGTTGAGATGGLSGALAAMAPAAALAIPAILFAIAAANERDPALNWNASYEAVAGAAQPFARMSTVDLLTAAQQAEYGSAASQGIAWTMFTRLGGYDTLTNYGYNPNSMQFVNEHSGISWSPGTVILRDVFNTMKAQGRTPTATEIAAWQYAQNLRDLGMADTGGGSESHATGGPTYAGRLYEVNERGTELFVPAVNGVMLTADQTRQVAAGGAGGGVSLVIHIDARGSLADPRSLAEFVREKISPELAKLGQLRSGPAYAGA